MKKDKGNRVHKLGKAFVRKQVPIVSPLRYPGSKRRLAGYIQKIIEMNNLKPSLFVEPFAGGASVSLQLLKKGTVEKIGLIEKDPLVASFWKTVFFDADWLVDQVENIEVTMEKWKEYKYSPPTDRRGRAIACLFLNRTSFSGILAPRVGPIGGWGQKSKYKIDCRFTRETLVKRIREAEALKGQVAFVWNLDWEKGLNLLTRKQGGGKLPKNVFLYFDPPFFEKADQLYAHYFVQSDHERLKSFISNLSQPWVLSYDSATKVKRLYKEFINSSRKMQFIYSSASSSSRKVSEEALLTNLHHLPGETRLWRTKEEWKHDKQALEACVNIAKSISALATC